MYDYDDSFTESPLSDDSTLADKTQRVASDLRGLYDTVRRDYPIGEYYAENPYVVLAAAAGVGYVLAGGLLSPFTRRLMRVGMKALVLPIAAGRFKGTSK